MNLVLILLKLMLLNNSVEAHTYNFLTEYSLDPDGTTVSFYGDVFHGRQTASGEIYDQWAYTCASPDLPFGTRLLCEVEGRTLWVTVNDRGPFAVDEDGYAIRPLRRHPIRGLDMSKGSFQRLHKYLTIGVAPINILEVGLPI